VDDRAESLAVGVPASLPGLLGARTAPCARLRGPHPPLSIDGAQKLIERLGETARLPFPIHIHMLRHSAGYALAGRGVDTRTLQAFMGHRSISNTVIYTGVADKRVRTIWQKR
jgi:site-specific recombinase XerD